MKREPIDSKITEEEFRHIIEQIIPLHRFMGIKITRYEKDFVEIHVPFRSEVVGNFKNSFWHGGMLAAMMDAVGGAAATSFFYPQHDMIQRLSTIDMRIDYIKPVLGSGITVCGKVIRGGDKTILVQMEVRQEGGTEVLADGRGIFNVRRPAQSAI